MKFQLVKSTKTDYHLVEIEVDEDDLISKEKDLGKCDASGKLKK